jgi:hypothetical protein
VRPLRASPTHNAFQHKMAPCRGVPGPEPSGCGARISPIGVARGGGTPPAGDKGRTAAGPDPHPRSRCASHGPLLSSAGLPGCRHLLCLSQIPGRPARNELDLCLRQERPRLLRDAPTACSRDQRLSQNQASARRLQGGTHLRLQGERGPQVALGLVVPARGSASANRARVSCRGVCLTPRSRSLMARELRCARSASASCVSPATVR